MRQGVLVSVVMACGGGGADECPTVYVALDTSICVEGGLADVDLDGAWLLTGTETETVSGMSPSMTTKDISEGVAIDARCEQYDAPPNNARSCSVDTTLAACVASNTHARSDDSFLVCRDAQGVLRWQSVRHYFLPILSSNGHQVARVGALTHGGL